jgi:hypothetical protein
VTVSGAAGLVVAHGGGLPEAATIGVPVLALVVFVVLERRARRRERANDEPDSSDR